MDWTQWHLLYDRDLSLQARLRVVQNQVESAIHECPFGSVRIVSICSGDGRDVIQAVQNHPRRGDVTAYLSDNRHLVQKNGATQVPMLRNLFRQAGFAVALVRFSGSELPLDLTQVLFEFGKIEQS